MGWFFFVQFWVGGLIWWSGMVGVSVKIIVSYVFDCLRVY